MMMLGECLCMVAYLLFLLTSAGKKAKQPKDTVCYENYNRHFLLRRRVCQKLLAREAPTHSSSSPQLSATSRSGIFMMTITQTS